MNAASAISTHRSSLPSSRAAIDAGALALHASGLCKRYGSLQVTDGVELALRPGARTALIGPNGAGKTTLVNLLSGAVRADAGRIMVLGEDLSSSSADARARRGLIRTFQISSLFANLSVFENFYIVLAQRSGRSFDFWHSALRQGAVTRRARSLIERLRLDEDSHRRVSEIAYGRQRLVEIGMALALEPKVLLLDEPAAGIPSTELDLVLDAVASLPRDIAVLMIEHDMEMVRRIADQVVVLVQGSVLTTGTPAEVMADPEVQRVYLGDSGRKRFHGAVSRA
jgi:branched-chain amino acid transport system ATP-binding protein